MKQDEIFDEEKEFSVSFLDATKSIGRDQLKSRLSKLDSPSKVRKLNVYWIAASMAILIIASLFTFKPFQKQDLYTSYYHKMPNKVVAITRGENNSDQIKLAFLAYELGRYEEAKMRFTALSESNSEVVLYEGIIAMEEMKFEKAISIFRKLEIDSEYKFKNEVKWYLALSYMKSNMNAKAKSYLQELLKNSSDYTVRAQELLDKL